jgi:hypothetical protein
MKRAAFGLLCLFVLIPAAAFADSLDSISPNSFYSFELEQNATLHGFGLFGTADTKIQVAGPAGTFIEDNSGGSHDLVTGADTVYLAIPDSTLLVEGHYSVTVLADDGGGSVRSIGPVFYDVVARPIQQNPLISVPEAVFAEATSAAGATVNFYVTGVSFVDAAPVITCDHNSGEVFHIGETAVHCTATDSFGSASGAFSVFVFDSGRPVVTVPADIVTSNPVVTFSVTANDVVDGPVTVTCSPHSGSTFPSGTTTVNCIAYDSQANAGSGSFNVTVSNGPVLTLPAPITAEATSSAGAIVSYTATATDSATVVCTPASGSAFALGTTAVNCTATSSSGTTSGSFTVTVVDTTPPALSLPASITAEATGPGGAAVTYSATATDIVDGSRPVTCDHASGSTFPLGTTTVQCTASDTRNNTAQGSFTVTVRDTTPPALSLPANITAEATSPAGADTSYSATSNDLVDGSRPVTCDRASGSTFPLGTTTVQCTASDTRNNVAHGSFTVTVVDTTPPVLSLPADITVEATGPAGATASYSATSTDLVDGSRPVTCTPASGSTFPLGTTTVQCTATDTRNNVAHGSFTVTVRDTTPPVLSLPANITAEATGPGGAAVSFSATSADIVDGSVPVTCNPASGSTFALGTTTVQCTATDAHNNTAHGSFTVTVRDTTPPTIVSISASPGVLWPPNHQMVNVTVSVIATDLVDPAPMSHIVSVSSNQPIDGTGDGDTAPDWVITGPLTLQLRSERASGIMRIYTITVAATDATGNTSQRTVTVTVGDGRGRAVR